MHSTPSPHSDNIHGPAYRILTERLVIRCWQPADAEKYIEAVAPSIEHLKPWLPWAATQPLDMDSIVSQLRRFRGSFDLGEDFVYAILDRQETRILGGSGLHTRVGKDAREIGYWVRSDIINKGIASETAAALTRVAFEVDGVQRIEIHCAPANVRSAAVPRKLGFRLEATLRQRNQNYLGEALDSMIWTMLSSEYPTSPAAQMALEAYDAAGRICSLA